MEVSPAEVGAMEIVEDPYMYSSGEGDVVAESSPAVVGRQEFQPLLPNPFVTLSDGRVIESKQHYWARFHAHMKHYGGFPLCPELRSRRQQEGIDAWFAVEDGRCLAPDEVTSGTVVEDITDDHVPDNAERLREWRLKQKRVQEIFDMDQD